MQEFELLSQSPQQTQKLAQRLASSLRAGDLLVLTGDLGAGKTTFVQGLARGLGVKDLITSPTFTIIREYYGTLPLYHFDLFRLEHPRELEDLGYEEYFNGEGVVVIEWGDKAKKLLPEDSLVIEFHRSLREKERLLKIRAEGKRSKELLGILKGLSK